ncbi:MAG: hypothetical protein AAFU81_01635 [Pseudomonadota bacterium]
MSGFRPVSGIAAMTLAFPTIGFAFLLYWYFSAVGHLDSAILSIAGIPLTGGFVVLALAGLLMSLEIAKSADTGIKGIMDLAFSVVLFAIGWVVLFTQDFAQTEYFLILCLLQTADALGGGTVAIISARRDFATGA